VRVRRQRLVDALGVRDDPLDEGNRVPRDGRLTAGDAGGEQPDGVDAALLGLEQDVEGPLARLVPRAQLTRPR
jgi:hypothetical protein